MRREGDAPLEQAPEQRPRFGKLPAKYTAPALQPVTEPALQVPHGTDARSRSLDIRQADDRKRGVLVATEARAGSGALRQHDGDGDTTDTHQTREPSLVIMLQRVVHLAEPSLKRLGLRTCHGNDDSRRRNCASHLEAWRVIQDGLDVSRE
jgi:hypothetical protein